eukprot:gnl/MRDRNA2_/MRDRNA2_122695_c0_seq1.p1 gnl/MRDRNA2_/MRDRNA2_122695_c0~~gnl/MRDRNA2_/MRDRNA2_122695_c0_seq1.p1  ORF type:complete len:468 (+),score=60.11 gnl/MRDRNA2_/MRDRNA2_122695_c0_seq1:190-1593(+)
MVSTATEESPLRGGHAGCCTCSTAFRVRMLTAVASLAEGYDLGIMGMALGPMQVEFDLDAHLVGIVVSSLLFASVVAAPLAGSLPDVIGRKLSIAISAALIFGGNLCWALAPNVLAVIIGRLIIGIGIGLGIPSITMYMAEVAPADQRGFYVSIEELLLSLGILLGFAMGALLIGVPHDWRIMVALGAVLPLVTCICVLTPCIPESPRHLQAIGHLEEAREILSDILHGNEEELNKAFAKWVEDSKSSKDWSSAMKDFMGPHFRSAVAGIGVGLFFTLTGTTLVMNYSIPILIDSGMSLKSATYAVLLVGIVKTLTLILPICFLMDLWGRRPLLLCSPLIISFACGVIAHGYFADLGGVSIVLGLCIFVFGFSLGIGPVYFSYISEVFDNSLRAKGSACSFFILRLTGAVFQLIFPALMAGLGVGTVFCALAGCNACAFVFYWFCCPETRGVPLEDATKIFETTSGL